MTLLYQAHASLESTVLLNQIKLIPLSLSISYSWKSQWRTNVATYYSIQNALVIQKQFHKH